MSCSGISIPQGQTFWQCYVQKLGLAISRYPLFCKICVEPENDQCETLEFRKYYSKKLDTYDNILFIIKQGNVWSIPSAFQPYVNNLWLSIFRHMYNLHQVYTKKLQNRFLKLARVPITIVFNIFISRITECTPFNELDSL